MKPTHFDESDALDAAIAAQIEKVRAAATVSEASRLAGVTAQAAILHALVSADAAGRVDRPLRGIVAAANQVSASVTTLKEATDAFTAATQANERTLTHWTKVQAFVTIVLAGFTLAQIFIAVVYDK